MANKAIDLTGNTYGRLTVISRTENIKGRAAWHCSCSCGGVKTVAASELKKGGTKSCGCLANEQRKAAAQSKCHEFSRTNLYREHKTWENMKARCYDKKQKSFADYGGRGITVCPEWKDSFEQFFKDMGNCPHDYTLDRIDTELSYSHNNCKWSSRTDQANNRRNNHFLSHNGETLTVSQWAKKVGVSPSCISQRLSRGWCIDKSLFFNSKFKIQNSKLDYK